MPKFINPVIAYLFQKIVAAILKGKFAFVSQMSSFNKVIHSPPVSSPHHPNDSLLPLPTSSTYVCCHCGKRGHMRSYYEKLIFYPHMRINISTFYFSSPHRTALWSQRPQFSHSYAHSCHLRRTIGHIFKQCTRYVKITSRSSSPNSPSHILSGCIYYGLFEHVQAMFIMYLRHNVEKTKLSFESFLAIYLWITILIF